MHLGKKKTSHAQVSAQMDARNSPKSTGSSPTVQLTSSTAVIDDKFNSKLLPIFLRNDVMYQNHKVWMGLHFVKALRPCQSKELHPLVELPWRTCCQRRVQRDSLPHHVTCNRRHGTPVLLLVMDEWGFTFVAGEYRHLGRTAADLPRITVFAETRSRIEPLTS